MLVIRRRVGESLLIGDDIEVEILDSGSSQVKLGIRAPRSVGVRRKEIRIVRDQNRAAARALDGAGVETIAKKFKPPVPAPISAV
jgi:carbon storage regulator